MADNYQISVILSEAKKQGLLNGCKTFNPCYHPTINNANLILFLIKSEGILSTAQLSSRTGLNLNTTRIYLRELRKLKLIDSKKNEDSLEKLYFLRQ